MSDYYNILTNLGRSKITDLITSDTALENIQIAFGDGNGSVPTPNPTRTALVNEVHRRPANKLQKHPTLTNSIIVDVVIPNNVGGFWIREFGIYFDGVLICNGSLAPTFKEASDDTLNTYRLKPYINIESDRLKVVEIESDLINATESWTQENFIKRTEIVDNLITADPNKPLSANAGKSLQDGKLGKNDNAVSATKLQTARTIGGVSFDGTTNINLPGVNAAGTQSTTGNAATATTATNCSRSIVAGNGLSGGGDLTANRTVTLGTPTKITSSSTNSVTTTSHTHEIDNASTSVAGVVQLNNTLTSTSSTQALTAAQGKVLNDQALGVGQTWQNLTGSRSSGTIYLNNTPRPILIKVSSNYTSSSNTLFLYVNEIEVQRIRQDADGSVNAWADLIVPSGSSYRIDSSNGFSNWSELR